MSSLSSRARLVRLGASEDYGMEQLALCAVVVLAPAAFFACAVLGGGGLTWWWLVLTPVTLLLVRWPESSGHLLMWAALLVAWVTAVPGPFTWWSVPAALAVAASHTALSLLGGRPFAGDLARDTWRRVGRRLAVVAGIATAVAALAQAVRAVRVPGVPAVVVVALLVLAGWVWWGGRQLDHTTPPE